MEIYAPLDDLVAVIKNDFVSHSLWFFLMYFPFFFCDCLPACQPDVDHRSWRKKNTKKDKIFEISLALKLIFVTAEMREKERAKQISET
jgi:hypothetical protein